MCNAEITQKHLQQDDENQSDENGEMATDGDLQAEAEGVDMSGLGRKRKASEKGNPSER